MEAYTKSKTPENLRDKRGTPVAVFERIQEVLGLMFCHDVCAEPHTAKIPGSFWTKEDDALSLDWADEIRRTTNSCGPDYTFQSVLWMNPPYSDPYPWVKKAAEEAAKGLIVVGLVPDDRSTLWYQDYIEDVAPIVFVPDRRIAFINPETGEPQPGNPKGSVVPMWTPWNTGKTDYSRFKLK